MISSFPPTKCGIADYTFELTKSLVHHGVDVDVLTYNEPNTHSFDCILPNLNVYRVLPNNANYLHICKELKKISPDLIHLQSEPGLYKRMFSTFVFFKGATPLITTAHGTSISILEFVYKSFMLRWVYSKSNKIIAHSNSVKQSIKKFHGIDTQKICVMPLGVNTELFNPSVPSGPFKKKHNIENNFTILFFGFLLHGKGLEYLLEAFKKILSDIPNAKLVIAGGDHPMSTRNIFNLKQKKMYSNTLKKLAKNLQIEDNVLFTGHIPDCDISACLTSADILIFPNIHHSSQSVVVLQALASGCPIIATNTGSFPEFIIDNDTGILIPPRDSDAIAKEMLRLWGNDKLRHTLGKNARNKVESEFSLNNVSVEIIKIYKDVLSGRV